MSSIRGTAIQTGKSEERTEESEIRKRFSAIAESAAHSAIRSRTCVIFRRAVKIEVAAAADRANSAAFGAVSVSSLF